MSLVREAWAVVLALAPWLLLGAAFAGVLHVVLGPHIVRRRLRGPKGVLTAVALGVPLPLCSCGVIPAALGLRRDGASRGAAIGFMVATPQTGVDSVMVAASMLGWPFALFKVITALVTGTVAGLTVELTDVPESIPSSAQDDAASRTGVRAAYEHARMVLHSIWRHIVLGIAISAAIAVLVPPSSLALLHEASPWLVVPATVLVAVPLYVCATASVPIAASLVAAGFPPGAALVFLLAGPATNTATIAAIASSFGRRALAIYLATIIAFSIAFGLAFDAMFPAAVAGHVHGEATWWSVAAAVALLGMLGGFALADVRRWWAARSPARAEPGEVLVACAVDGMHCEGCMARLDGVLRAAEGVHEVHVTLEPGRAEVRGRIDEARLRELVEKAGYRAV